MPQSKVKHLLEIWAASILQATQGESAAAPFDNHSDLFKIIDATPLGDVPWRCFTVSYNGPLPESSVPSWMTQKYEVWYRCPRKTVHSILANPDFNKNFNTVPYREYTSDGKRKYTNLFSGNWAWRQAVSLSTLYFPSRLTHCTRISLPKMEIHMAQCSRLLFLVATRQQYQLLLAKQNIILSIFLLATFTTELDVLIQTGFLLSRFFLSQKVCPLLDVAKAASTHVFQGEKSFRDDNDFQAFRCHLFHSSLSTILQSLRPGMTSPEIARCPDGHFHRVVYGLGPFIADYPEQALATGVVQG